MAARAPKGVDWAAMAPETAETIRQAGISITTRRNNRVDAKRDWLRDGFDIARIREAAPHGTFALLVRQVTPFTPDYATRLARATDMLRGACKSDIMSEIPVVPSTVCVELALKETPQHVRDTFLPRVLAGERVKVSDIRAACNPKPVEEEAGPDPVAAVPTVPARDVVDAVDSMTDTAFRTVMRALSAGRVEELTRALEWRAAKPVVPHADRIAERAKAAARTMPLLAGVLPEETVVVEADAEEAESETKSLH